MIFEGQADATYMIRVLNKGRTKLISMNTKKLLENSHIEGSLSGEEANQHVERTQNLAIDITKWYQEFRRIMMLDFQDIKQVEGNIKKYWSYELI